MDEMGPSKDAAPRACTESRLCFVDHQSGRPESGGDEFLEYPLALERRCAILTVSRTSDDFEVSVPVPDIPSSIGSTWY
jgi:hypothetical protein